MTLKATFEFVSRIHSWRTQVGGIQMACSMNLHIGVFFKDTGFLIFHLQLESLGPVQKQG